VSEEPAAGRELPATEPLPARAEGTDGAPAEVGALVPHGHLGRRNDRLLLAAVASYAVILSVLMIARGISVTPELIVIAFGLAALLLGRGKLFVRDWIPFLALFFAYELMRGYADKFGLPIHVTDVVSIERIIGLGGLPTTWLQGIFHSGPVWTQANPVYDNVATLSVVFYFLHFPLPLAVGFLLWIHHRRSYYDYVAALILLSMAAYVTFLLLPVAPPWWAAQNGYVTGVLHLRDTGFNGLVSFFGFGKNNYLYSYSLYSISSNDVAAFPSLHAAYPFLAFLFARRAFGRAGWLMAAYTACVWFSIVYLGEHWVVDIIGGVVYASVAYLVVLRGPAWGRRFLKQMADEEIEAGVEAEDAGDVGALRRIGRRVRWALVVQGAVVAVLGLTVAYGMDAHGWFGGSQSGFYMVPWLAMLGGLWRGAVGLVSR
jgi:membrane-associated phospholipid phosphatase